jgi:copper resistance protein C
MQALRSSPHEIGAAHDRPSAIARAAGRGPVCAVAVLMGLFWPDLAAAHAVLLRGTPAGGAAVPAGHLDVDLRFNSRIEHAASQLQLQGPDGAARRLTLTDGPVDALRAAIDIGPGSYTLQWQVLAVDGHLTRGSIPFTVTEKAPAGVVSTAQ